MGEKKEKTDEQKYSQDFEDLSKKIVKYLFRDTGAEITSTKPSKDGGYDIIVSCRFNHYFHKAFFECKLRNKNLTLRDIAANAIIAFNMGSTALVAVTNHGFTQQAGEHLRSFQNRTVLNIKIITGAEFWKLIEEAHMEEKVPEELKKLIRSDKTGKAEQFEVLRLDFDKNIIEQVFCKEESDNSEKDTPISQIYPAQMERLVQRIEDKKLIVVTGYWGLGKSELIHAAMRRCGKRVIEIDASLPTTRDQLILTILSELWGIPETELFSLFTKEQVNQIAEALGGQENDRETIRTLVSLFNSHYEDKRSSAVQNMLLAQYIVKLLILHKENINFAIYVDHLQFSSREIYDFLDYFIKELHENRLGCVVKYEIPEYQEIDNINFLEKWRHSSRYTEIELVPPMPEDAVKYIKARYPKLSDHVANVIVDQVGTRIKSLSNVLTYLLEERCIPVNDDRQLAQGVQVLTANDVPGLMDILLREYRSQYPDIFALSYLLDCRIPLKIYQISGNSLSDLERLIAAGIFRIEQNVITAQNGFVQRWIQAISASAHSYACAEALLEKLGDKKGEYTIEKISLYHAVGKDMDALALLDENLHELTRDKQYTALERGLTLAIEMASSLRDIVREALYLIQFLDLMTIQKKLTDDAAQERIARLAWCIEHKHGLPPYMPIALAYFQLKRSFKRSEYADRFPSVEQGRDYYTKCIHLELVDNDGDWLGQLCSCYALTVKLTQGNDAALQVFENAMAVLPKSFELRREYLSHLACMELFDDPAAAFGHYQAILTLFEEEAPDAAALPFHEYGDLAMSQLIAGNLDYAGELTERAIQISRSNGLIDEEGRNINIRGCIELCAGRSDDAKASFREATATMRHAGCWNYAWRSELNYIELCCKEGDDSAALLRDLERLYDEFKDLLSGKIASLVATDGEKFCQTREYHALLVFGFCLMCLHQKEKAQKLLLKDFALAAHAETFQAHLKCFLAGKFDFMRSPYLKNGAIYLVG